MNSGLELVLVCFGVLAVIVILFLISFGEIGPEWLKNLARRYQKWWFGDASPLLPIDPYKPISSSSEEPPTKFPPFKTRLKNALLLEAVKILVIIIVFIIIIFVAANL